MDFLRSFPKSTKGFSTLPDNNVDSTTSSKSQGQKLPGTIQTKSGSIPVTAELGKERSKNSLTPDQEKKQEIFSSNSESSFGTRSSSTSIDVLLDARALAPSTDHASPDTVSGACRETPPPTDYQKQRYEELIQGLTQALEENLQRGEIIMNRVTKNAKDLGLDDSYIKSRGSFSTPLLPTFHAYKIIQGNEESSFVTANKLSNPSNAKNFIPDFEGIEEGSDKKTGTLFEPSSQPTYILKSGEKITLSVEQRKGEENSGDYTVFFDQIGKSDNLRKIKGSLTVVPIGNHQLLTKFEVFVDFRGKIVPRLVQTEIGLAQLETGIRKVFENILDPSKEN